ncbi:hypothetical protein M2475_001376 [Breznakia sp. PF5-3]|uniref:hypothetical protein n=1 Tax=unclassified Breznakia TaxID=2623764 RepID=UPI002406D0ED|nr:MULTISPECIES: hypothetical protein [unclassified Breznakia]MDF9824930.1 hypothetical protein [Breznakia sp. PM6-1]MDF9835802.1 hypothetical protein [Breznakia sp. PF5-3]MDF9837904.1 hypothetical protein [Breznakia sp. PFB2-8]MDF9859893.1 hypothetical protein [Breznakia sp. PH5-24]
MKKLIFGCSLLLLLVACGSESDYYVCKYNDRETKATMNIEYNDDNEITNITIESKQEIDKATLDEVGENNFNDYWAKNASSIERDGVDVESDYDESTKMASLTITIDISKLPDQDRSIFLIPDDLKVKDMIRNIEDIDYVCND